jgi:hypothetical protein
MNEDLDSDAKALVDAFEADTGIIGLNADIKRRADGNILVIDIDPIDRFYEILQGSLARINSSYDGRVILHRSQVNNWLIRPEVQFLQKTLGESLTIGKNHLGRDFFQRYIPSGTGHEDAISSKSHHLVCGRRGTGKSSLLLYGFGKLIERQQLCLWVSMQRFEGRTDWGCAVEVLKLIAEELLNGAQSLPSQLLRALDSEVANEEDVRKLVPRIHEIVAQRANSSRSFYIFLDDYHTVGHEFQSRLASILYGCCRDNHAFLKFSGVETFTHLWNAQRSQGLQEGQDIQKLSLDYNLENVDNAREHIEEILDRQADYCGINHISRICSPTALNRLVWLAAGVPRDAISIFAKAVAQSRLKKSKSVSITSLNLVASTNLDDKVRMVKEDAANAATEAMKLLEDIKIFCLKSVRKNAFLVRIDDSNVQYLKLMQLVDLRLLHVINRGITPDRPAERYAALLLDYGFYVGSHYARTVDPFEKADTNIAKTLRGLPRLQLSSLGVIQKKAGVVRKPKKASVQRSSKKQRGHSSTRPDRG